MNHFENIFFSFKEVQEQPNVLMPKHPHPLVAQTMRVRMQQLMVQPYAHHPQSMLAAEDPKVVVAVLKVLAVHLAVPVHTVINQINLHHVQAKFNHNNPHSRLNPFLKFNNSKKIVSTKIKQNYTYFVT